MPAPSSNLPGRLWPGRPPSLFGLAPNGVCRACRVAAASGGLLPHRFTLTPRPDHYEEPGQPRVLHNDPGAGRFAFCGAFRGSPLLGVTQRPALWSPDFPLRAQRPAATVCPTPALFTACLRLLSRMGEAPCGATGIFSKTMSWRGMGLRNDTGVNPQERPIWELLQAC